jgi:hypothetical protein
MLRLVFLGSDAVTSLSAASPHSAQNTAPSVVVDSRDHAVFILQHMLDAGILMNVVGSDNFRDNSSIYRLMQKTQLQQLSSLL